MSKRSQVWEYFTKLNNEHSQCNVKGCCVKISCKGGNTTAMKNHLAQKHEIKYKFRQAEENLEPVQAKISKVNTPSIFTYVRRESLNEILAKCAAKDGFSFLSMTQSEAIKGFVAYRNYTMPKSVSTVQKHVMEFFEEKKQETYKIITGLIATNKKFSITVDEWTDINMRRFLNITLHSATNKFVLGLIKINGSCTAEVLESLVRNRLLEYGVELNKDVVASTHDGASVMVKYGKLIGIVSQLCYNHAIHLVVVKTIYNNICADNTEILYDDVSEDEDDDENGRDLNDNFYNDGNLLFDEISEREVFSLTSNIKPALDKMRQKIRFFKKSAVRSDVLSKYVIQQEGKNLKLILDCKTRWNTLISAVNRFVKLINCINSALNELGAEKFADEDIHVLEEISFVLEPLMVAVEELSKETANLITAEGTLIYIFKKLKEINTPLSQDVIEQLKFEFEERRNKELITLLLFLHHGKYPKNSEFLIYSSKTTAKLLAKQLINRFNPDQIETEISEPNSSSSSNDTDRDYEKTVSMNYKVTKFIYINQIQQIYGYECKY